MNKWVVISSLLGLIVGIESVALYSIQKYSNTRKFSLLLATMLIYGVAIPLLLYQLLKYKGIGMVNFLWNVFSTLIGFFIGIMIFKEKVNGIQWIGVALGILAFAMIILGSKQADKKIV